MRLSVLPQASSHLAEHVLTLGRACCLDGLCECLLVWLNVFKAIRWVVQAHEHESITPAQTYSRS